MQAQLAEIELPDFGMPETMPHLAAETYTARLARLRRRMKDESWDAALIYADREHSANLSYLSGFDPRFEEAMLIVGGTGDPLILVGNECVGMAAAAPLEMRIELYQDFSLPSQPRDKSRPLGEILAEEGLGTGARVGMIGWKTFDEPARMEIPAYIVAAAQDIVGPTGRVANAGHLFIDAADGLRVLNEVDQLAVFEYAACQTSQGVRNLIFGLEPGMTEQAAVRLLEWNGSPLSCHLMLTAGARARLGLLSPSDRRIERGDPFTVAFGIWGALNCRAGFVIADASELPLAIRDYVAKLVTPYFEAIVAWYEALHVGQRGGVLYDVIHSRIGDPFFGLFLNPGHQIHLDEWVNSPVGAGSGIELRSGMAMQVDVIPATGTEYFTTNIEDGIALADATLRAEFAAKYPDAWQRIESRRAFMRDVVGIRLHDDVLPFSNIPAYLTPFLLSPQRAMTIVR